MPNVFEVLRRDHDEVKAMLVRLEAAPPTSAGATSEQVAHRQRMVDELIIEESKHEAAEQQYFWPMVRALGPEGDRIAEIALEQQANELGDKIIQAKKLAPTRPHPHTPPTEGAQKAAGPVAGVADRVRDAVTGRGRQS